MYSARQQGREEQPPLAFPGLDRIFEHPAALFYRLAAITVCNSSTNTAFEFPRAACDQGASPTHTRTEQ